MAKETLWEMTRHTAAKHTILRKYLDAWMPILGGGRPAHRHVVLIDAAGDIGRSTFTSSVLPYIEAVDTPSDTKLIPADELEPVLAELAKPATTQAGEDWPTPAAAPDVVDRIRRARVAGLSLRHIADRLNAEGVPTAQGGERWWASSVRSVLGR
jgi:hypothetical protein